MRPTPGHLPGGALGQVVNSGWRTDLCERLVTCVHPAGERSRRAERRPTPGSILEGDRHHRLPASEQSPAQLKERAGIFGTPHGDLREAGS